MEVDGAMAISLNRGSHVDIYAMVLINEACLSGWHKTEDQAQV